jgi:hypothetical protein
MRFLPNAKGSFNHAFTIVLMYPGAARRWTFLVHRAKEILIWLLVPNAP